MKRTGVVIKERINSVQNNFKRIVLKSGDRIKDIELYGTDLDFKCRYKAKNIKNECVFLDGGDFSFDKEENIMSERCMIKKDLKVVEGVNGSMVRLCKGDEIKIIEFFSEDDLGNQIYYCKTFDGYYVYLDRNDFFIKEKVVEEKVVEEKVVETDASIHEVRLRNFLDNLLDSRKGIWGEKLTLSFEYGINFDISKVLTNIDEIKTFNLVSLNMNDSKIILELEIKK